MICRLNRFLTRIASGKPYGVEGTHKLAEGSEFTLGSREVEIDHKLSREDFLSGRCFGKSHIPVTPVSRPTLTRQFVPLKPKTLNGGNSVAHAAMSGTVRARPGFELEPVNLVGSEKSQEKESSQHTCWTANWYVSSSEPEHPSCLIRETIGASHSRRSTRLGTATVSCCWKERS